MDREILFRAKPKDDYFNKGWQYGLVYCTWFSGSIFKYWLTPIKKENLTTADTVCVNPETICEYTGIADKNGVKIFDGDIVRIGRYFNNNFYTEDNYVCRYDTNTASFKFYYIVPKDIADVNKYAILGDGATLSDMGRGFTIEVIGNIYDNPELIEE